MRRFPMLVAPLAAIYLGCSHSTVATTPPPEGVPGLPDAAGQAALGTELVAGLYTVALDLEGLDATVTPQTRATQANDDLYLLPITRFMEAETFRITSIRRTDTTIDVTYRVTHPTDPPVDPAAPASGLNRADLGIAGLVLFMIDVPSEAGSTYFDEGAAGRVIANTQLVTNPDAYFRPRAMLPSASLANTFPYQLLVDESAGGAGTRVGISNNGEVTGNFDTDGWTRSELGAAAPFTGWTGYGVLHQGQASANTLRLDREVLTGGSSFVFDVALLAKYNDPRGGLTIQEQRANRLPPEPSDTARFAYRMPHGALDVQRLEFEGVSSGGFITNEESAATLGFHLEDWDARAIETSEADLANDLDVTRIAQGEAGLPALAVSIPGVFGGAEIIDVWDPALTVLDDDVSAGGDLDEDSGRPGDALFYRREVPKPAGTAQLPGFYTGMARALDPEPATLIRKLDANLVELTIDPPIGETYQAFEVVMTNPLGPDAGWAKLLDPGIDKWAEATGVTIDSQGNVLVVGFFHQTIDFGGGLRTSQGGMDNYVVKFDRSGQYLWDYTWGSDSDENYRHVRTDPVTGVVYLGGSFDGVTDFDGTGPTPPISHNVREDAFLMKLSAGGVFQWVRTFGALAGTKEAEVGKTMAADATGVYLGGFFRSQGLRFDATDPNFWGGSIAAAFIVKLLPNGDFAWSQAFDGGDHDEFRGIASDQSGGLLGVCDFYSDTIDFGGGPIFNTDPGGTTDDMALIRLDAATGAWIDDHHVIGSDIEQPQGFSATAQHVAVTGHTWSLDLDLGGGEPLPHFGGSDFYWGRFDAVTLEHQFSGVLGSESYDPGFGIALDPSGAVYVAGLFQGPIDFGFGTLTPVMQDGFLYKLDPTGDPAWVHTWGGAVDFVRASSVWADATSVVVVGTSGVGGPLDYQPGSDVFELTGVGICGSVIRDLAGGTW